MKISLNDFKNEVLRDYKIACLASIVCDRSDVAMSCGTAVAQVALAKYIKPDDRYWPATTDIPLSLSKDYISLDQIKSNRINQYNNSIESACSEARKMKGTQGGKVVFTVDSSLILNSNFFGQVIGASDSAIAVVVWGVQNDILTINMLKMLGAQSNYPKGSKALNVSMVKGNDYAALCRTFEQQFSYTSTNGALTITIVENTTNDSLGAFETWILDKGICEKHKLEEIKKACQSMASL